MLATSLPGSKYLVLDGMSQERSIGAAPLWATDLGAS
jgi:hypothetical protein